MVFCIEFRLVLDGDLLLADGVVAGSLEEDSLRTRRELCIAKLLCQALLRRALSPGRVTTDSIVTRPVATIASGQARLIR